MDVAEDEPDLKLQQATPQLIADLDASLRPLLWGTTKSGSSKIRTRVRNQDLSRLLNMIDTFQELPQLLDPQLDNFIPLLAGSFLIYLQSPTIPSSAYSPLLVPIHKAICQLLYRFCKVRGEKVIVRFFSTEIKHIELLLSAVEKCGPKKQVIPSPKRNIGQIEGDCWSWEEIYISLLWLSQLLLAPFDLASISSENCRTIQPEITDFLWPSNSPEIVLRIIPLSIHYLSLPGKEKDATRSLLVRLSMRRDMQENGTMNSLTRWAIAQFRSNLKTEIYHFLGVLSFLAGLLASSVGTMDMKAHLWPIFEITQKISCLENPLFQAIHNSAVARKLIIKILRSIAVIALQHQENYKEFELLEGSISYMLEAVSDAATPVRIAASKALSIVTLKLPPDMADEVIQDILSVLQKNVLWVTVGGLRKNIDSPKNPSKWSVKLGDEVLETKIVAPGMRDLSVGVIRKIQRRDISRVNLLEWHGCIMTLSHLIYRHAISSQNLGPILAALRLGLSFEQRSTSGSSLGTNVCDAACFGLWALARKYKTAELQKLVVQQDTENLSFKGDSESTLQILASDLVVSATLDPAGNIRRGSSAALQELIGRHPNTIQKGIELVQIIDYHTVAWRDRAIGVVALNASALADSYYTAVLENLVGWRGIKHYDKSARKVAATTMGRLVWEKQSRIPELGLYSEISRITDQLVSEILLLKPRESDERHGLILSLAAVIEQLLNEINREYLRKEISRIPFNSREPAPLMFPELNEQESPYLETSAEESPFLYLVRTLLHDIVSIIKEIHTSYRSYRSPQSTAEAVCQLINVAFSLSKVNCIAQEFEQKRARLERTSSSATHITHLSPATDRPQLELLEILDPRFCFSKSTPRQALDQYEAIVTAYEMKNGPPHFLMSLIKELLDQFLKDENGGSVDVLSIAAANYGLLCGPEHGWFLEWQKNALAYNSLGQGDRSGAYIYTIFQFPTELYYRYYKPWNNSGESFASAVYSKWHSVDDIEIRIIIMRCLATSSAIRESPVDYIDLIKAGMDDHTTTSQGDVGSLLRIASIQTAVLMWDKNFLRDGALTMNEETQISEALLPRLIRLASEKLDRVRAQAKTALLSLPTSITTGPLQALCQLEPLSISSKAYFLCLLNIHCALFSSSKQQDLFSHLISTFVVSADSGSEDVTRAARAALVEFCQAKEQIFPGDTLCSSPISDYQLFVLRALLDTIDSGIERVVVQGIEILAFLIGVGILHEQVLKLGSSVFDVMDKALHNCRNFKRLQAGIKIFGALLEIEEPDDHPILKPKAIRSLTQTLVHRYPKIRMSAADEIFFRTGLGKGVDWTNEKKVSEMRAIRGSLLDKLVQGSTLSGFIASDKIAVHENS